MLEFEDGDDGKPAVIKTECSDAENAVDEYMTKCPKSEENLGIKCEEIDIKEELDIKPDIGNDSFAPSNRNIKESDSKDLQVTYKCPLCPFISKYKAALVVHRRMKHAENIKMYKCKECSFTTKYRHSLMRHRLMHADPKVVNKFKCEKCLYQGRRQCDLNRHNRFTHSKELPIREEIGNDSFASSDRDIKENDLEGKNQLCPDSPNKNYDIKQRNIRVHSVNKHHSCLLCKYITDNKPSLRAHLSNHKGRTKEFGCHKCHYETDVRELLTRHFLDHKDILGMEMYKCPLCPFISKFKSALKAHQRLQHDENIKMYKCKECLFTTKYKQSLMRHQLTHADPNVVNKFKCEKCPYQGKRQYDVDRHNLITHSEEILIRAEISRSDHSQEYDSVGNNASSNRNITKNDLEEKNYVCPKCLYSTKMLCNFNKHIYTHSDDKQHRCILCSFVTDTRLLLRVHMTSHRGATKKYGCGECSYETNWKPHLRQHIIRHKDTSEVEMHKCVLCPFQSKYRSRLVTHRRLMHDNTTKMHKCEKCSFSTKYRSNLVTHHLVHEDPDAVNKFKCEECPFRTKWQKTLQEHMTCHFPQKSKVYSCDECTYSNKAKSNLLRHKLVHQVKIE